jgi:hypothetical protein
MLETNRNWESLIMRSLGGFFGLAGTFWCPLMHARLNITYAVYAFALECERRRAWTRMLFEGLMASACYRLILQFHGHIEIEIIGTLCMD